MTSRLVVAAASLALSLATSVMVASAQQPAQSPSQPTFRTATLLTELDVLPVGPDGTVVTGLTADDFEVVEDGEPQSIDSVEFIDVAAAAAAPLPPGVVSNAYRTTSRVWVVVVDDLRLGRALQRSVREVLATLVARLSPDDLVALVPTSGRRESRVEFTRDKPVVLSAVKALRFAEAGVGQVRQGDRLSSTDVTNNRMPPAAVRAGGGGDVLSTGGGTEPMLDSPDAQAEAADDRLLTTLADVSGMVGQTAASRVMVVLVSTGLAVSVHPEALRALDQKDLDAGLRTSDDQGFTRMRPWEPGLQRERRMLETVQLIMGAQRGRVTVYAVNPLHIDRVWSERLTAGMQQEDVRERLKLFDDQANPLVGQPYGFLGGLTAATGGLTFTGLIDPEKVAETLLADSGQYYLVRYYPTRQERDDRMRAIAVRATRSGVIVRTRTRYAAIANAARDMRRADDPLGVTLGEVLPRGDLRLEMRANAEPTEPGGQGQVRLVVRVVPDGTVWSEGDRYDVRVVAIGADRRVQMSRTGTFGARSADPGVPRGGQVVLDDLPPGRYQCRVAVQDRQNGRVGSIFLDVEVPTSSRPRP